MNFGGVSMSVKPLPDVNAADVAAVFDVPVVAAVVGVVDVVVVAALPFLTLEALVGPPPLLPRSLLALALIRLSMAPLGSVRKVEEKGQGLDFDSRLNLDTF